MGYSQIMTSKASLWAMTTLVLLGLAGCASNKPKPPAQSINVNTVEIVDSGISQAAHQAAQSLQQLAAIEKSRYPKDAKLPFADIHTKELDTFIAVKWYGPCRPLLQQVANKIGYQLQVYGKPPQTPILVRIDDSEQKTTAINLLRDIDLQAANNADILIYPRAKLISLRYTTHGS